MKKRILTLLLCAALCLTLLPVSAMADTPNPNNYKATITRVSVGAPITGVDGKKYIPVDVHFTAEANPDESGASMLEGVIKAVHDGAEHFVQGVGMTLMGVSGTPGNNQFSYDPNTKRGVAKFNVPVLDSGDAQTVEHSQATGLDEVNGVKADNAVKLSFESVVYGHPDCPIVPSNEAVFEYKPSELPKSYAYDITETWDWHYNTSQHWEVCTDGDSLGQTRNQGPHTYNDSPDAAAFSVSLPEGFDAGQPLSPDNSPTLTDADGTECVFDGYGFKNINRGGGADDSEGAPAPVFLASFADLKAGATVKARFCDACCYTHLEGGVEGQVDGAAVSTDKLTAAEGEEVEISVTPDSGKVVESVTVESGGQSVPVEPTPRRGLSSRGEALKYYYTQPAGNVTITVTMKDSCEHPNKVTAFDDKGHWLYCPDCEKGIEGSYEEHFAHWQDTKYEQIETVRVTVANMEQTEELPVNIRMGTDSTVQFLGENKTFTYLPDNSGFISCKDDESESWYIPGGFEASHKDPPPALPDVYSVMIPGADMEMRVEYEDCGYGILDMFVGHGPMSKIWADKWFATPGETVTFGVSEMAGYRCSVTVKSGNTVISYAPGNYEGEFTFTMPAGNVTMEISAEELPALVLPDGTLRVEESAFENCGAYVVKLPEGCTSIGPNAFKDCGNLEAIYIPTSVTTIDETAFDSCTNVCIYGEEDSKARDYANKHNNTYFWDVAELG